jgi:hypothetical protein
MLELHVNVGQQWEDDEERQQPGASSSSGGDNGAKLHVNDNRQCGNSGGVARGKKHGERQGRGKGISLTLSGAVHISTTTKGLFDTTPASF